MLKKSVQQGCSERRGEEVYTALRVGRSPCNGSWRTERPLQRFGPPRNSDSTLSL
jgi:hypothetical protein